jgi:hypothetical protein
MVVRAAAGTSGNSGGGVTPSFTFANLNTAMPPATTPLGTLAIASDVGFNGILVFNNGAAWRPLSNSINLNSGATPVTLTGTLTETALISAIIPANFITGNGALKITGLMGAIGSVSKTYRVRLGGAAVSMGVGSSGTGLQFASYMYINSGGVNYYPQANSINPYLAAGSGVTGTAVDWTQPQTLEITGQLGLATDTIVIEGYMLELLAS